MTPAQIDRFFATLQAANPQPASELEYTSVFELLTAVLLSAQATDVGVNKATRRLFPVANTPQKILALGQDGLEGHIKTIGLFRSKAKRLMQTWQILVERHGGQVPRLALVQPDGLDVALQPLQPQVENRLRRARHRKQLARGLVHAHIGGLRA